MAHIEYLVMRRNGQWWLTRDAVRLGPYVSQNVATSAALQMAKQDFKTGQASRVSIDEPEDGVPVIYDSGDQ